MNLNPYTIHADEQSCAGQHVKYRRWLKKNNFIFTADPLPKYAEGDQQDYEQRIWDLFCSQP